MLFLTAIIGAALILTPNLFPSRGVSQALIYDGDNQTIIDMIEEIQALWEQWFEAFQGDFATYERKRMAKAQPDECFFGNGDPANDFLSFYPNKMTHEQIHDCVRNDGIPKVNQGYVWGMARHDTNLFFGTAPNYLCLVADRILGLGADDNFTMNSSFPIDDNFKMDIFACEFGANNEFGSDWRPPDFYMYDTKDNMTEALTDLRPLITGDGAILIEKTEGIRSVGAHDSVEFPDGVAFMAGPNNDTHAHINLFAFNATTGDYMGAATLGTDPPASAELIGISNGYTIRNIRKWLVVNDHLYTATGPYVLKWRSDRGLFSFEVVGFLENQDGAELAFHEGRIFVGTWPGGFRQEGGLWMSPLVNDGLDQYDQPGWTKVWTSSDYEPDPVSAAVYATGAMASYGDHLYWGTMHVPGLSSRAHSQVYFDFLNPFADDNYTYPSSPTEALLGVLGSYRTTSLFRGSGFGDTTQQIDLLYGSPVLPVFEHNCPRPPRSPLPIMADNCTDGWAIRDNNMGGEWPLYGPPGFGNPFNNYTWAMEVFDDQLFVGTMDHSYLLFGGFDSLLNEVFDNCTDGLPRGLVEQLPRPTDFYGADLFRFYDSVSPAMPESLAGVGNYSNYGARMLEAINGGLYVGIANPMNLLTNPHDEFPEGGWELIRLAKRGDLNLDGEVSSFDFPVLNLPFFRTLSECTECDLNEDGRIDWFDFFELLYIINSPPAP